MFERVLAFLKDLPPSVTGDAASRADDPRIAAAALMYHVMDADGVRQDTEWEQIKVLLAELYGISGDELDDLVNAGQQADSEAIDLYAFTSVLKRHLDEEERVRFIRVLWDVAYADGELHELEDNTLWRVAELIGVDRRNRIAMRQEAARRRPDARGASSDE
ncbi:MAG: TerB family tellurite resistance protein [Rhizobiaceae bacterium]